MSSTNSLYSEKTSLTLVLDYVLVKYLWTDAFAPGQTSLTGISSNLCNRSLNVSSCDLQSMEGVQSHLCICRISS